MRRILLIIAAVLSLCCCTHNNGDIGPLFGTWKMSEVKINGIPDTAYRGNLFWMFQSTVLCMRETDAYHDYIDHWATWSRPSSSVLRLDFTNSDHGNPQGSDKYSPAPSTLLPADTVVELDIQDISGSEITLRYRLSPDTTVVYHLVHW